jgi:5-methylcytosine-specific restriction endonuclease McrA
MDDGTRLLVRNRADYRCEYCLTRQIDEPFATYQLEHIVSKKHGGTDVESNLALACPYCNSFKGPNLSGLDPLTGQLTRLFHPRQDQWDEHFEKFGSIIAGKTDVGRTTVRVLCMNNPIRVEFRDTLNKT